MARRFAITVSLLTGLLALLFANAAGAAPVVTVVNNGNAGAGSLRKAIETEVDTGGTIVIPASVGPITLLTPLSIERSMTIEGAGSGTTSISGGGNTRVFFIFNSPTVAIKGVQILEGKVTASTGEIFGGGILQLGGSLTVEDSLITRNTLEGKTTVETNGAGIASQGAASLTLRDTAIGDNRGISTTRTLGGGVFVEGAPLTIEGGAVKGNTAEGEYTNGGGIYFKGTRATLSHVAVTGNELRPSGTGPTAFGAGVSTQGSGTADLFEGDTIARNRILLTSGATHAEAHGGGAWLDDPNSTLVNTTIANNTVSIAASNEAIAQGGGLAIGAPTQIDFSTISENTAVTVATNIAARGGNLGVNVGTTAGLHGTIVNGGLGSSAAYTNCYSLAGEIVSEGDNIDGTEQCGLKAAGDMSNTNPQLGPLGENGGPVETVALLAGSPAIGGADECPPTDARGVLRPGPTCDIGAFQVATPRTATGPASDVGTDRATLAGLASNPDLAGGSGFFEYGTATGYGARTAAQPIAATTRSAAIGAGISGLQPNTTYHYRSVVINAVGTAFGTDQTFTTGRTPGKPGPGGSGGSTRPQVTLKRLKGLSFRVHCTDGPCNGNIVATAHSAKRTVVVAKAKLRLPNGATQKVVLARTKKGKSLIAPPGKLPVVVRIKLGKGASVPKPLHLKLG